MVYSGSNLMENPQSYGSAQLKGINGERLEKKRYVFGSFSDLFWGAVLCCHLGLPPFTSQRICCAADDGSSCAAAIRTCNERSSVQGPPNARTAHTAAATRSETSRRWLPAAGHRLQGPEVAGNYIALPASYWRAVDRNLRGSMW